MNQEYIRSAGQADEYRTEPPFKLQGSYRNMNRLAEKVVAIMNDDEVRALVDGPLPGRVADAHHRRRGELPQVQGTDRRARRPRRQARWDDIKKTFKRNLLAHGDDQSDPVGRVVSQLATFQSGLEAIQQTLESQLSRSSAPPQVVLDLAPVEQGLAALQAALLQSAGREPSVPQVIVDLAPLGNSVDALRATVEQHLGASSARHAAPGADLSVLASRVGESLDALRGDLSRAIAEVHTGSMGDKMGSLMHEMEMLHGTLATLKDIARRQRDYVRSVEEMLVSRAKDGTVEIQLTQEMLDNESAFLEKFHQALGQDKTDATDNPKPPEEAT